MQNERHILLWPQKARAVSRPKLFSQFVSVIVESNLRRLTTSIQYAKLPTMIAARTRGCTEAGKQDFNALGDPLPQTFLGGCPCTELTAGEAMLRMANSPIKLRSVTQRQLALQNLATRPARYTLNPSLAFFLSLKGFSDGAHLLHGRTYSFAKAI
jgi:hypothetical protein